MDDIIIPNIHSFCQELRSKLHCVQKVYNGVDFCTCIDKYKFQDAVKFHHIVISLFIVSPAFQHPRTHYYFIMFHKKAFHLTHLHISSPVYYVCCTKTRKLRQEPTA